MLQNCLVMHVQYLFCHLTRKKKKIKMTGKKEKMTNIQHNTQDLF